MSNDNGLTSGAIVALFNGNTEVTNPIVQLVDVKFMPPQGQAAQNKPGRYRVTISDGIFYMQAMLATQLNNMVKDQIKAHDVIRITDNIVNVVQGRRVLILLALEVISSPTVLLGEPVNIETLTPQQVEEKMNSGARGGQARPNMQQARMQNQPMQQRGASTSQRGGAANRGGNRSEAISQLDDTSIKPIASLNPYQPKWVIRARVMKKGDIKTFNKDGGQGKLFSVDLCDEGGEIRATLFNSAVDKYHDLLQEDKVYMISRGRLKQANKKWTSLKHDYEMFIEDSTIIQMVDDSSAIPRVNFNFCPISNLNKSMKDAVVDVVGVVSQLSDVSEITTQRTNKQYKKRTLTLVDNSGASIELTIWGALCDKDINMEDVVAVRGAKVSDFNEVSLSTVASSTFMVNPAIDTADELKGWYLQQKNDGGVQTQSLSQRNPNQRTGGYDKKTISSIKDDNLGHGEKPDYLTVRATITFIKQDGTISYPACPNESCNKKLSQISATGQWRCEQCDQIFDQPNYRYVLSCVANDYTGHQWLTAFNAQAQPLLCDTDANTLEDLKRNNPIEFENIIQSSTFKQYALKLRCKVEMVNDEPRVKTSVMNVWPLDFKKESKYLVDRIARYQAMTGQ